MLKKIIFLLLVILPMVSNAQKRFHQIGLFAGVSYYMGDLNQDKLFYSVQPAFSFLYKVDLNSRYTIRLNVSRAKLHGSDAESDNSYQNQRNHSFNSTVTEFAGLFEFNFLPYKPASRFEYFSPYILFGIGLTLMPSDNTSGPLQPVIPFGFGIKYAINKRFGIAAEWTYRKTFTDYVDQLSSDTYTANVNFINKQRSYIGSKDWYSFAGISLTYKFALGSSKCPAYRN